MSIAVPVLLLKPVAAFTLVPTRQIAHHHAHAMRAVLIPRAGAPCGVNTYSNCSALSACVAELVKLTAVVIFIPTDHDLLLTLNQK